MPYRVFIPEVEWEDSHAILLPIAEVITGVVNRDYSDPRLLAEAVCDMDGIIITSQHLIRAETFSAARALKVVAKYGAFPGDHVDLDAATRHGIVVCFTCGANADSVAEHTLLLILGGLRRIFPIAQDLRQGRWRDLSKLGRELAGKTVGIIGFGQCGRKVAEKLTGFRVKIVVFDPYVAEDEIRAANAIPAELDTLLRQSDVVSVHAALSPATKHLIGSRELRLLKRSALLVNTSRGGVIDEEALASALQEGMLAAASLDVFEDEPASASNPLFRLDNVLATPHVASCTEEAYRREASMAALAVRQVLEGKVPSNIANPEVLKELDLTEGEVDAKRQ